MIPENIPVTPEEDEVWREKELPEQGLQAIYSKDSLVELWLIRDGRRVKNVIDQLDAFGHTVFLDLWELCLNDFKKRKEPQ